MSGNIFSTINPESTTWLMCSRLINSFRDAIVSGMSGTSRPPNLQAGGMWVDTSTEEDDGLWTLRFYTVDFDIAVATLNLNTGTGSGGITGAIDFFTLPRESADALGPEFVFQKGRITNNGRTNVDDLLGKIQYTGKSNTGASVIPSDIFITALEDGAPDGLPAKLTIRGNLLGLLTSALELDGELGDGGDGSVAAQLPLESIGIEFSVADFPSDNSGPIFIDAGEIIREVSGVEDTQIDGIEQTGATANQIIVIRNLSTGTVTLTHNATVSANYRKILLPSGQDYLVPPDETVVLLWTQDGGTQGWLLISSGAKPKLNLYPSEIFNAPFTEWEAPASGSVRLVMYEDTPAALTHGVRIKPVMNSQDGALDGGFNFQDTPAVVSSDSKLRAVPYDFDFLWGTAGDIGERSYVGRTKGGRLFAQGTNNTKGALGIGSTTASSSPVAVACNVPFAQAYIPASFGVGPNPPSYALTERGELYTWGDGQSGQLGLGDVTARSSPVAVLGGHLFSRAYLSHVDPVGGTGGRYMMALDLDGIAYAWGININGQLGLGDVTPRSSPVAVLGSHVWKQLVPGRAATVGQDINGQWYAWGRNSEAQLGLGDTTSRSSPVAIPGSYDFVKVIPGFHSNDEMFVGLTSGGDVVTWGKCSFGGLGNGNISTTSTPSTVLTGVRDISAMNTGDFLSIFAIKTDGTAYAWGSNNHGELGVGNVTNRSSPVAILGSLAFKSIYGGQYNGANGITTNERLYAWGRNYDFAANFGVGGTLSVSSPILITGALRVQWEPKIIGTMELPVEEGVTYEVLLSGGACYFGDFKIGSRIGKIEMFLEGDR